MVANKHNTTVLYIPEIYSWYIHYFTTCLTTQHAGVLLHFIMAAYATYIVLYGKAHIKRSKERTYWTIIWITSKYIYM